MARQVKQLFRVPAPELAQSYSLEINRQLLDMMLSEARRLPDRIALVEKLEKALLAEIGEDGQIKGLQLKEKAALFQMYHKMNMEAAEILRKFTVDQIIPALQAAVLYQYFIGIKADEREKLLYLKAGLEQGVSFVFQPVLEAATELVLVLLLGEDGQSWAQVDGVEFAGPWGIEPEPVLDQCEPKVLILDEAGFTLAVNQGEITFAELSDIPVGTGGESPGVFESSPADTWCI